MDDKTMMSDGFKQGGRGEEGWRSGRELWRLFRLWFSLRCSQAGESAMSIEGCI